MKHVLIVDDNTAVCHVMGRFLERAGFETDTAATVEEALHAAATTPPDMIICDWVLNGTESGLDLVRTIREKRSHLDALFITGLSVEHLVPSIAILGLTRADVLEKPFSAQALVDHVRQRLG